MAIISIIKFTTCMRSRLVTENRNAVGKPEAMPIFASIATSAIFTREEIRKFHTPAVNIISNCVEFGD